MNNINETNQFPFKSGLCTVTLTGIGANTDLSRVRQISQLFPLVEWGILLGSKDTPRYPTIEQIDDIIDEIDEWKGFGGVNVRIALHLCGKFAQKWINGDEEIEELVSRFHRMQINVREDTIDIPKFIKRVEQWYNYDYDYDHSPPIITQHNKNNINLTNALKNIKTPNHNLLFDTSGGNGIACSDWPESLDHVICGYAGGLSPATIEFELRNIRKITNGKPFWVDMESKLRDENDELDLNKCIEVLNACTYFKSAEMIM